MAKFHKQNYELVMKILAKHMNTLDTRYWETDFIDVLRHEITEIGKSFANEFDKDNSLFDKDKFKIKSLGG